MTPGMVKSINFFERFVLIGLLVSALGGGAVFGWLISDVSEGRELSLLANYRPSTPTRLYDRNGKVFAELYRHKQELIRFQNIPPHVVQAFLASEDDNFFNHFGIDFMGIVRAAITNIMAGGIVQGGSTLTQQLAKQIYLSAEGSRSRTFTQKIRETILALQIEENLSKEEILEVYFNVIYLGHGCQGLVCASRVYFEKKPQDLTLPEAALLARLPKAPVQFSPFKNPHEAMRQHKITLRRMAANDFIKKSDVDPTHAAFWNVYWGKVVVRSPSQTTWSEKLDLAPYFTDHVRSLLVEEIGAERLYTGGLKVYTTLDLTHQRVADSEIKSQIKKSGRYMQGYARQAGVGGVDNGLFSIYYLLRDVLPLGSIKKKGLDTRGRLRKALKGDMVDAADMLSLMVPAMNEGAAFEEYRKDTRKFVTNLQLQGAFLSIEPRTGYITAMVGGSKFSPKNQYNRALRARRQPGSAFKVFVYGGSIANRDISSKTALNDAPFFTLAPDGSSWTPMNYGEGFRGLVPASKALAASINTCAVEVFYKSGPEPIIDFAAKLMKITDKSRFSPDPAMALGVSEVTPFELATALSIIQNQGRDVIPFAVRYVTDQSGNVIYNKEALVRRTLALKTRHNKIQIIEPGAAYIVRKMMEDVANRGTPTYPIRGQAGFRGDLAVKTGTTSGWSDAWIVGFNPEYASVVWFGFDKKVTMGPSGSGGPMAGPVIGSFYRRIYQEQNLSYPRWRGKDGRDGRPSDVTRGRCGGYAMASKVIRGRRRYVRNAICASDKHRMYDQRQLIMKELGITKKDLGIHDKGKVEFKREDQ